MKMYDIITKKKRGGELSREEIREMIADYTAGKIPDYQMSALLMAIYFKGMTDAETVELTRAVTDSGEQVELARFGDLTVDKHSSGGVGDKTTLIVAPIAAYLGAKVAKMTGRGLGHTGGTADKLESIPGFRTSLSTEEFLSQVENIGIAVVAQNASLAPADKKLYALRDVTATVDSIPLIVSSIMGKKLAAGSKNIVLDVKYGSGSFMKRAEDAKILAEKMVAIGKSCGRRTSAVITNMDQPLGYAVGNALEVKEAIEVLRGGGPSDLREICVTLAANMVHLALGTSLTDAERAVREAISGGGAFEKLCEWISAQGGDASFARDTEKFGTAKFVEPVYAVQDGCISAIDAEAVGLAALTLGAGRSKKDDVIDPLAGIILTRKVGEEIRRGDVIAYLHTDEKNSLQDAKARYLSAIKICDGPKISEPLIYGIIG